MKNIILIAAPAAGKGTEAALLKEKYNMPHISTGDMLREKALEDSELGRDINYKINNGIFVSDELIIQILKERISEEDCKNGYILDGFPRGPSTAGSSSPASFKESFKVDAPTAWKTRAIQPSSAFASAIVSGMRSPKSRST